MKIIQEYLQLLRMELFYYGNGPLKKVKEYKNNLNLHNLNNKKDLKQVINPMNTSKLNPILI